MISFSDFLHLGADQWRSQRNPLAALFFRLCGPLGTHARIRNARVLNTLQGIDLNGRRVLDVGCGHGYTLFWLARRFPLAQFEGMDVDAAQIEACQEAARQAGLTNLHFRQGIYSDLPDKSVYDLIIAIDVLEHVHDDIGLLKKAAAILRPNGRLVIHVPLRHQVQRRVFPAFRRHIVGDHVRDEYLPDELLACLGHTDLQVQRLEYGFGFWGELSFEINNLFWHSRLLRNLTALVTFPVALLAGYADSRSHLAFGNSIVVLAARL